MNETHKVDVVFCIPGDNFSGRFLDSLLGLINFCNQKRIKFYISRSYSSVVHFARSKVLGASNDRGENQSPFGGKIDYDFLMFIDSDMVFSPHNFEQLIIFDVDIVSGIYKMSDNVNFTSVEKLDNDYFIKHGTFQFMKDKDITSLKENINKKAIEIKKSGKSPEYTDFLAEVAYNGMGWMLIKKGVFESIKYPWFHSEIHKIGNRIDFDSEDVAFCRKAKEAGYKIYIDPNCRIGHEKRVIL